MIYGVFSFSAGAVLRLLLRPKVEGRANIPVHGPFILASNHLSFVDSFVLSPVIGRRVCYLARAEYFELPGRAGRAIRWGLFALGNVPIRRGPTRAAVRALEQIAACLHEGGGVAIYPEGSRSPDGRIYRGRTGVAWLAMATGAPVVPVALGDTDHIIPLGSRRPRLRVRPTVRIGEPMDFTRYRDLPRGRARRVITDEIMDAICKLSDRERAGVYNPRAEEE
ncbi:1-acyl-sn-glycerol-3-phosphate acyltransferase [Actinomadura sp. GC306]|uniref:lysophospholipid acyltransferase family protein n=1 Tax=Actinomadura sp. GC306 TaxID=2530367 RepID=UPI0010432CE0|nr:lysophospholipid acyltransferase family protein [Actinomadura sp. GC306]TDC61112.1 1-acyl-sn-glycerol-3-phosphate acyltransferase [Actinomadura sp. GC306]